MIGRLAPLPRKSRHFSQRAASAARRHDAAEEEGRARGGARRRAVRPRPEQPQDGRRRLTQRREVVAVQPPDGPVDRGGELPVLHDRTERGEVRGAGRAVRLPVSGVETALGVPRVLARDGHRGPGPGRRGGRGPGERVLEVRSTHWSPYDRVGVVNADP
eukprot:31057-Pelagococcus_subviridis.AAC.3